jgi:hypothetical protein
LFLHCAARQNVNLTGTRAERSVELTGNNRNLQTQAITGCLSAMLRSSKWVRFALAQLGVTCFHPFAFLIA